MNLGRRHWAYLLTVRNGRMERRAARSYMARCSARSNNPYKAKAALEIALQGRPFLFLCERELMPSLCLAEQVRHDRYAVVTSVIQARQSETAFQRFQQRVMQVTLCTLHAMDAVVRVDDQEHLVGVRSRAVIILVPQHHDGIVAFAPRRRPLDRRNNALHGDVTTVDQRRVQSVFRAIAQWIKVAKRPGIAAAVLVVALAGSDEGE